MDQGTVDRRTIIGFILMMGAFFLIFWNNSSSYEQREAQQQYQDSIAHVQAMQALHDAEQQRQFEQSPSSFLQPEDTAIDSATFAENSAQIPTKENSDIILQNNDIKLTFSTLGGVPVQAELKNYKKYDGSPLYLFLPSQGEHFNLTLTNNRGIPYHTQSKLFVPNLSPDSSTLELTHYLNENTYIKFTYQIDKANPFLLNYKVTLHNLTNQLSRESVDFLKMSWHSIIPRQEENESFEKRYSQLHYKLQGGDVEKLSDSKNDSREVEDAVKWISFKNQFFHSTLVATNKPLSNVSLKSKPLTSNESLKELDAFFVVPTTVDNNNNLSADLQFIFSAVDYSLLKGFDKQIQNNDQKLELDKLVPLGWTLFRWVNQYFVIPLFNLLSSWGFTTGIIILLMTIIVKIILSPFTFKAFMSSAKMRVLRPQVMAINEKYPGNDKMMERQRATMDLYSRAGVSPMGGCLPMLLQMPILLALFSFFPSAIELRQQSFLWAKDLASYDAILSWDTHIPLVSTWFGNHVSLFCLLMTLTNVVYMKFSMDQQDTGQQQMPGMKMIMYLMPIIMLVFLNSYPSGLTYYYFVSTLITIILTMIFRYTVDEEKVLAKLEENKRKPRKKSGFMARLEEAQRIQQQRLREQQKANNSRKRRR